MTGERKNQFDFLLLKSLPSPAPTENVDVNRMQQSSLNVGVDRYVDRPLAFVGSNCDISKLPDEHIRSRTPPLPLPSSLFPLPSACLASARGSCLLMRAFAFADQLSLEQPPQPEVLLLCPVRIYCERIGTGPDRGLASDIPRAGPSTVHI